MIRWSPFRDLLNLHEEVDRLFNDSIGGFSGGTNGSAVGRLLPIDIRSTDKEVVIEASVPGFRPEEVEVSVDDDVVTIKGEKAQETEDKQQGYIRKERYSGSFYRQISVPGVHGEKAEADFVNGVLTVTLPKVEPKQPKRITVKPGSGRVLEGEASSKG